MTKPIAATPRAEAQAPPGAVLYAVGDIHGRLDLLTGVTAELKRAAATARSQTRITAIFLGDYIDRGPAARGVIDHLMAFRDAGVVETVFLRGNHEQILLDLIDGDPEAAEWLSYGGVETLRSYGGEELPRSMDTGKLAATARRLIPDNHLQFLRDTKLYVERGDYLFVHAGLRPDRLLSEQSDSDLLWYRFYADETPIHGKTVVHGHTPRERPLVGQWRIGIDTEAYASGALTAVRLEGERREFLKFEARAEGADARVGHWATTDRFADRQRQPAPGPRGARSAKGIPLSRRAMMTTAAVAGIVALVLLAGTAWRYRDAIIPAPPAAHVSAPARVAARPATQLMAVAPAPPPQPPPAADPPPDKRGPIADPPKADPPKADPPVAGPRVQIGALPSEAAAQQAGERARRAYAADAKNVEVEKVTTPAGATLYRAYLVGFDGDGEAASFCRKLAAAGAGCIVRKTAG